MFPKIHNVHDSGILQENNQSKIPKSFLFQKLTEIFMSTFTSNKRVLFYNLRGCMSVFTEDRNAEVPILNPSYQRFLLLQSNSSKIAVRRPQRVSNFRDHEGPAFNGKFFNKYLCFINYLNKYLHINIYLCFINYIPFSAEGNMKLEYNYVSISSPKKSDFIIYSSQKYFVCYIRDVF